MKMQESNLEKERVSQKEKEIPKRKISRKEKETKKLAVMKMKMMISQKRKRSKTIQMKIIQSQKMMITSKNFLTDLQIKTKVSDLQFLRSL